MPDPPPLASLLERQEVKTTDIHTSKLTHDAASRQLGSVERSCLSSLQGQYSNKLLYKQSTSV